MLARQRRQRILDLLQEDGTVRVAHLRRVFGVSAVTIRKDLDRLAEENLVTRGHGGAFLKSVPEQVRSLSLQHQENLEQKARIGEAAARLVGSGDRIILDSGSTATEIAKRLADAEGLTVLTNALNIALILGASRGVETWVTGGEFKAPTLSLTGEKAAAFFGDVHVDKLFLATAGVSFEGGLTYPGFSDLPVKRAMVASAGHVYLVADSTKVGRRALARLGGIDLVDTLITDDGLRDEDLRRMTGAGVEVIVA